MSGPYEISSRLAALLEAGTPPLVVTGAGISAESGLATFRGPDGLWEGRDPMELATPEAFEADPAGVWRFYDWRRKQAAGAEPNPAHQAIARWQQQDSRVQLVTQNVDGLHERAGSTEALRLHGTLWRLRCTATGEEHEDLRVDLGPLPPRTPSGDLLRPGVVWFGEGLDPAILLKANQWAADAAWVLVVGTSSLVYPAAGLPLISKQMGAYVVEINVENTALTERFDEHLRGSAVEWLPRLVERLPDGARR